MRGRTKLRAFGQADGFLEIAFGSLRELHDQLGLAIRLGFASESKASGGSAKMEEAEKVLGS